MGDKDLAGVASALRAVAPVELTFIRGEAARYATAEALRAAWGVDAPMLTLAEAATRLREPAPGPRLVTGSLYLLGDLLRTLGVRPF
jgi:dihydrofolate synthase/folylpolyglutamate synthase